jgi:hypothetical protein
LRERLLRGGLPPGLLAKEYNPEFYAGWLEVYQISHAAHLELPDSAGGCREIVAQPKVFESDTGLVCHARCWGHQRSEDCGVLWEHLVPEKLTAAGVPKIHFGRYKQQREMNSVVPRGRATFREQYPKRKNRVVSPLSGRRASAFWVV